MRGFLFSLGLVLGIVFSTLIFQFLSSSSDPNKQKQEEKLQGKIVIVIGWNGSADHISQSFCMFSFDPNESAIWNEWVVKSYKDKREAIEARNKALKAIKE